MAETCSKQSDALPDLGFELVTAICTGHVDHVIHLLDHGVALEDASMNGYNALHYAAVNGRSEIVQILIKRGFHCNTRDKLGYTPLHLAAAQGHLGCVTTFIEASCSINNQEHLHGNTAIHEAAWNGFSQTLQELVKHKADVNLLNKAGFSALHLSSQNGHNECSRILLYAGCKPNYKNSYGDTALHTAARYGHAGVTRILLIAKCRVNEQNENGDTALHIAAALKLHKITKMLLQAGCNTNITNNQNERACDIARRKGHGAISNLLYANTISSQLDEPIEIPASQGIIVPPVDATVDKAKPKRQKWSLFMKKSKSKDAAEPTLPPSATVTPSEVKAVQSLPPQQPLHLTSAKQGACPTVSVDPDVVLRSFQLHQLQKHRALKQGTSLEVTPFGNISHPIQGMLGQYANCGGIQYYRDLAGNIKQGPIGYMPGTTMQQPQLYHYGHYSQQPPVTVAPSMPASGLIQNQFDHLSYLRSRNTGVDPDAPRMSVCRHFHTYEQPFPSGHGQRMHSSRLPHRHNLVQNFPGEVLQHGSLYRSKSDETLSTASSYQLPSVRGDRHRNLCRRDMPLKRHKSRNPAGASQFPNKDTDYFMPGNSVYDAEIYDRQHRYKKSQRKSQASHLRKKAEKLTSTSSESCVNSSLPTSAGKLVVDAVPSRIDATSNPDSGYGDSKTCLKSATTSMQQLTLSSSCSFQNEDELRPNGSENKLTSSTDNGSVISSAHSGSVVSLCNSL